MEREIEKDESSFFLLVSEYGKIRNVYYFDICSVTNSTVPAIKIALEEGKKPVFSTLTVCYSCNGS